MKKTISTLLLLLALALPAAPTMQAQCVQTWDAPQGANLNDDFSVAVVQDGRTYHSPCYLVKVDSVGNARHNVLASSLTQFSFEGDIEVRLHYNRAPVTSVRVRPLSAGIVPRVEGNDIVFSLHRPANLSVEVNGDIWHNLQLFANEPETEPQSPHRRPQQRIEYGPGIHHLPGDSLLVPSNTSVHLAGGAVIHGRFIVADAENVSIWGRGIIDCNSREGVSIRRSNGVAVDGIVTTQVPVGESRNVSITNVKVITSYGWGDGLNVFASSDVSYDRCFARTSDDCHTVYATRKGFTGSARNIVMRRSVLWADVAHPIFIGLHGNVERPDTIEHLRYYDLDILEQREPQIDYQGCIAIGAGDLNLVRDVLFDSIRVEEIHCGQLFNMRTTWNQKYCRAPGRAIEDVTLRNVSYTGAPASLSIFSGYSPDHPVRRIRFENLRINGEHIYDAMPQRPRWYKTSDFANMYIGENVHDVTFE